MCLRVLCHSGCLTACPKTSNLKAWPVCCRAGGALPGELCCGQCADRRRHRHHQEPGASPSQDLLLQIDSRVGRQKACSPKKCCSYSSSAALPSCRPFGFRRLSSWALNRDAEEEIALTPGDIQRHVAPPNRRHYLTLCQTQTITLKHLTSSFVQVFWDSKNPEYMPVFSDYGVRTVDIAAPGMVRSPLLLCLHVASASAAPRMRLQRRKTTSLASSINARTCM